MSSLEKSSFQCEFCDEVSSGSLKRHVRKKHPFSKAQETSFLDCLRLDLAPTAKMKLELLTLKGLF